MLREGRLKRIKSYISTSNGNQSAGILNKFCCELVEEVERLRSVLQSLANANVGTSDPRVMASHAATERIDMTTRNHTPGPWHFDAQNSGINSDPGWGLLNADGESLGITVHWDRLSPTDTAYANARLIAAAPDLLAALQRLRDAVQTAHVGSDERCNDCAVCVSLKLADAALSKAAY